MGCCHPEWTNLPTLGKLHENALTDMSRRVFLGDTKFSEVDSED